MKEELRRALWPNGPRPDIWAIVDSAQDQKVYWTLTNSFLQHCCLFAGKLPQALEMAAPYLVQLDSEDKLTAYLAENMGRNLGIFLRCDLGLNDVRKHLRSFLTVKDMRGQKMLFRYYDPRILRVYLPTCNASELQTVFGPIKTFWAESDQPGTLTQFEVNKKQLQVTPVVLAGGANGGDDLAPEVVPAQSVLVLQRGSRSRVPVLLQGAGAGAKLRRSSGAIRIYRTPTANEELAAPEGAYVIPSSGLDPDVTVYAEAAAPGEVTLTLELLSGGKARTTLTAVELSMETGGAVCCGVRSGRRRIDVLPAAPRAFQGRLQLRTAAGGPSLTLYTSETSATGFPLADGFNFDVPGDKVSFWVEGETASTRAGDATILLGVDGSTAVGVQCPVTVASVTAISATVPVTASRTGRLPLEQEEQTVSGQSLVLLSGAVEEARPVRLAATTAPEGVGIAWSVERAEDDGEAVLAVSAKAVPTLTEGALLSDAAGTFRVRAAAGGAGEWGGPVAEMEIVLVHAAVSEHASVVNGRLCGCARVAGTDRFALHAGAVPAVQLDATVRLTGGGPDGRRGVEAVRGGWIGNIVSENSGARYKGGSTTQTVYKYKAGAEELVADLDAGPLLDARAGERTLPGSTMESLSDGAAAFRAQVAPGVTATVIDGTALDKTIEQIWSYSDGQAYLTLWTEEAPGQLGVLAQTGWSFTGDYVCTPAKTVRTTIPARLAGTRPMVFPGLTPAGRTEMEAHPPVSGRSTVEES